MKARVKLVDEMSFIAHADSNHTVFLDASKDIGGSERGMRPMEMLLTSLGGCTAIDVVHILRRGRQPITDCEVIVTGERADTVPKVFEKIHVHYVVWGDGLAASQVGRAVKLSSDKYCSVSAMLSGKVEITHDFEIRGNESGKAEG